MLSKRIFQFVKQKIPRISDTELIALRSGNTSLDRDIFKGIVTLPKKIQIENKLPENMVSDLLDHFDDSQIYPNDNNHYWVNYLAKQKFFCFFIDEKYGGIK